MFMFMTATTILCQDQKGPINKKNRLYTERENTIRVKVNKEFSIILDTNPTTGYQWQLANPLDEKILKLTSSDYKAPKTKRVGAGGKEVWTFKALAAGQTTISFKYVRPWEKDKEPEKSIAFAVNIDLE
jgi:inhibitor of cysteine peptidase